MAECGRSLPELGLLLLGRNEEVCLQCPSYDPPREFLTSSSSPWDGSNSTEFAYPWLFTPEPTCSPMVFSALFAQED
jgi:hypothetical protein